MPFPIYYRQPNIWGTAASETINGTTGSDLIDGHYGNDTIYAGGGDDTVLAEWFAPSTYRWSDYFGWDVVYGGSGNDRLDFRLNRDPVRLYGERGKIN